MPGTIRAIRGAIQVTADEPELIIRATEELITAIMAANNLLAGHLISLFFTATPDLRSAFPAAAARRLCLADTPLMCACEIDVPGTLPRVVRLMAHVDFGAVPPEKVHHIYLHGAETLRSDLIPADRSGACAADLIPADRSGACAAEMISRVPSPSPAIPQTVLVIGVGLIGTSVGLALRARGAAVSVIDRDRTALAIAVRRGAGSVWTEGTPPADLAVIAVPPQAVPAVLSDAQRRGLARSYTDVASVKTELIEAVQLRGCDLASFVPAHPMAGAETSGPDSARADLFRDKPWVLCADERTSGDAIAVTAGLATLVGARPVKMDAESHDTSVALTSHLPHLVSSAMAAALVEADPAVLLLAGSGLRDVTRIAAGDPALWTDILGWNAMRVARLLSNLVAELSEVCAALQLAATGETSFMREVTSLLSRGQAGRRLLVPEFRSQPGH